MSTDDLYRILRTGHLQAQGIVDTIAEPLLVLDANLCVQAASRSSFETFGVDSYETLGQPIYELGNGQWDIPELRALLERVIPKATAIIDYEVEHDFPRLGRRTMLITARTLHHPDGGSRSMLLTVRDATEHHRADLAKDLAFGELRHRLKNLLGVARSIASQTTTEGLSAAAFRDAFLGRLNALIQAEDLAFEKPDETSLKEVLGRLLAPYSPASIEIEPAPVVELTSRQVRSLCLVLHEMATNAAKYGALSVPDGRVRVGWQIDAAGGELKLTWVERGGPLVTAPTASGYGTTLIQSTIAYNLQGHVDLAYPAEGFQAEIVIPFAGAATEE
ncbi:MAG: histidine kinase [Sphingomonas sp. 66-10]|uniref:HWE histidine kinase domain-containing protein n=1 Tax=Sphingomonas sp. 66-10 TaxID=1895848 RepID=UPI0009295B13|nr:HWE histidine kinase domain-containing protein [Sphingomonas sp. 66-10]OJU20629.1 MAG: histidine kinase [Sphingomonas sp. 66-10]